jgi:nitrate/nitrite transport system permease protein
MKHAYKPQPQAGADSAPGEVITLPPLQVRKTTPPLSRWLRDVTQRLLPPLLGLGLLLLGWQLAAMNSKGFPTPLSTLDSALTLLPTRFIRTGRTIWASAGTCWRRCSGWRWDLASPRWREFRSAS